MRRWSLFAIACVVGACSLRPLPPAPPKRQTTLDVRFGGGKLANGLRVVVVRDPKATEVQVTMRYRVGALNDPPERQGMAHLVEHLMFEQVLGGHSLMAHLQDKASSFNAMTSLDATTFFARGRPELLELLLSIEAVRLGFRCAGLSEVAFAREREVVINEARQKDAGLRFRDAIHRALFTANHPYGASLAGTPESIGAITREEACRFADAHYAPSNAVLVVSGNFAAAEIDAALGKFLAKLPARTAAPAVPIAELPRDQRERTLEVPIDGEALVLAWAMPTEPGARVQFEAAGDAVAMAIDSGLRGAVAPFELGDVRAPVFAIAITPVAGESLDDVAAEAKRILDMYPHAVALSRERVHRLMFERLRQSAIHQLFEALEHGVTRDIRLAEQVFANRDPDATLAAELAALRDLTRGSTAVVIKDQLSFEQAVKLRVTPASGERPNRDAWPTHAIEDPGLRRDPPDPADAERPLTDRAPVAPRMTNRTLPNGMKVVLVPQTSVPTVDIRLVFASGTANETAEARGAAIVASRALTFNLRHFNDFARLAAAGGVPHVDVGTDHTTFGVRGVDMHLDLLLAGLLRWTRDGRYDAGADAITDALRREAKRVEDEGAITDAWRTALFGANHPYVAAGYARHTSGALGTSDAERFRATHYTPDNATLVIAGRFDPEVANRWIDFLFADWRAPAASRQPIPRATFRPAAIARVDGVAQVVLDVAFPATAGDRPRRLVTAEMLALVAADVRHQLGASYGLDAWFGEAPAATHYRLAGSVDAARADAVVRLLSERLAALRTDKDAAARAFVTARRRVLARLTAVAHTASGLASQVESDVAASRWPMSNISAAEAVAALTLVEVTATLADLDLARAAILARGPQDGLDATFAALGRDPTYVTDKRIIDPFEGQRRTPSREDTVTTADLEDALTEEGPPRRLTLLFGGGYAAGRALSTNLHGGGVFAAGGVRYTNDHAVGVHASFVATSGTSVEAFTERTLRLSARSFELGGFAEISGSHRLWARTLLGLRYDTFERDGVPDSTAGVTIGLQAGFDAVKLRDHRRVSLSGSMSAVLGSDITYAVFTLGAAYRY